MADITRVKFNSPWTVSNIETELNGVKTARGSGTMSEALAAKQDLLVVGTNLDSEPTAASNNPVRSGGVVNYVYGASANTIPENANLNTYTAPGSYRCASNAIAATLANCPVQNGFRMEVMSTIASAATGYQIQTIYPNNDLGKFYMRRRGSASSGTWSNWFEFAGTEIVPTSSTITGVPPIQFDSVDGSALTAWEIYGNCETGTPNVFCGDRSSNEFDAVVRSGSFEPNGGWETTSTTRVRSDFMDYVIPAGTYTINAAGADDVVMYAYTAKNISSWSSTASQVEWQSMPYTFTTNADLYLRFAFRHSDNSTISGSDVSDIMLNLGSSDLPYEKHGYKMPVTLAGVTQTVYLSAPLRKALDGSGKTDSISSTGTLTRNVDSNGDTLITPTTESITVPTLTPTTGSNTLTIGTTLQPSSVSITGKISET